MSKRKTKTMTIAPPATTERLSHEDRSAVRLAALEMDNARQRVALLVHEHAAAVAACKEAEQRFRGAEADVVSRYSLGAQDKVNLDTGEIARRVAS